ncbi:hypothetical protein ACFL54_05320 [Planctomycetota bacterium]
MNRIGRVQELTMKLIDAEISPGEVGELEDLVSADSKAVKIYQQLLDQEAVLRGLYAKPDLEAQTLDRLKNVIAKRIEDPVMARIRKQGDPHHAAGKSRIINPNWLWLAAAGLLLVTGFYLLWHIRSAAQPDSGEIHSDDFARKAAADSFYVLDTLPARQEAVVQDFNKFLIRRLKPGSILGDATLVGVELDTLTFRDADGVTNQFQVRDLNTSAMKKLAEETRGLGRAYKTKQFTDSDLQRLGEIAAFGHSGGIRLLEDITASKSNWSSKSETILKANEKLSTIREVIKWAKTGSRKSRLLSIHSLKKIDSPLVLQCLKDLAADPDENLALLALDMLATKKGENVLNILYALTGELGSETLRARAQKHIANLLKEIDHEK